MTDSVDVGAAVREARHRGGVTLRALAGELGVSAATLSAIENGRTELSVTRLHALASALRVSPAALLGVPMGREPEIAQVPTGRPRPTAEWRRFAPLRIDAVLSAAIDAFVAAGYHGTSMRTIADRAGLSVPGLYHHYPDKQALLVRIFDVTMTELHARVQAARTEAAGAVDEVAAVVEALALYHTHRDKLAFIGASEMRSLSDFNRRRIAMSRNKLQHVLDDAIQRAIIDGKLRTDQPRAAGRAISTMCTSLPQWFRTDGRMTPEQMADAYTRFALGMLGATTEPPPLDEGHAHE